MLQLNNVYTENIDEIKAFEENNHKGAFEYLPEKKEKTYENILGERKGGNFLSIKITASDSENEPECSKMVGAGQYFRVLAALARMGDNFLINKNTYEMLSMSYKASLEENTNKEALIINALIYSDKGEFIKKDLVQFAKTLAESLKISKYYPDKEIDDELKTGIIEDVEKTRDAVMKAFAEPTEKSSDSDLIEEDSNLLKKDNEGEKEQKDFNSAMRESIDVSASSEKKYLDEEYDDFNMPVEYDSGVSKSLTLKTYQEMFEETKEQSERTNHEDLSLSENETLKHNNSSNELVDPINKNKDHGSDASTSDEQETVEENEKNSSLKTTEVEEQTSDLIDSPDELPLLNRMDTYIPSVDLTNKELFYELHDVDENERTTASKSKLDRCFSKVMRYYSTTSGNEKSMTRQALQGEMRKDYFMQNVENFAKSQNANFNIPVEDMPLFLKRIERAFFSYYVIEPALNDPDITDIKITSAKNFNVKVKGKHYTVNGIGFLDNDDYITFLFNLLLRNNIQMKYPIIVFTDTTFCENYRLRFDITLGDINTNQLPTIHIRKVPKDKLTVNDLIKVGMMPEKVATYLREQVKSAKGIVFAGPSASGKTNAMNAFVDEIPFEDSVLCIQESDELFSNKHPNFMCQHILKDALGRTIIGLGELGQNGLLCDIKYFLIGEIKGAEAREFLRACNTGHKCMCTIHTPSSVETIPRFADYVKYGSDYSLEEAERMLKDLEIIVYIENFKVKEITRIKGYDDKEKKMIYEPIYRADLEK